MEHSPSSTSFPRQFWSPLPQKEWMKLIRRCLMFLSERDPPIESNLYKTERQILPDAFLESRSPLQFCYTFKGNFLPSGNLDGRVWKPSQGARPTGDGLMKRYFYYKEGSFKIKRQVIWLTNNENWCFLDYRCNLKGKIKLDQVLLPAKFEFVKLVRAVEEYLPIPSEINERKRKLEKTEERELSLSIHAITKCEDQYSKTPTQMNNSIVTSPNGFGLSNVEPLDPLMNSYYDVFSQDSLNLELEEFDFQLSNMDQLGEPASSYDLLPPLADFVKEEPQDYSTSIVPKRRKLENEAPLSLPTPPSSSYSFSAIDYLINHLLSYEQILDTICQSICTQLVFNRSFFKKMGKESGMLLHEVIQKCSVMTVDLMEFPGTLMSNFFGWLYESLWRKPPIDMPDVYCIICGKSNREAHDIHTHTAFFNSLDSNLVGAFKAKANNFYALVKEMVAFLLKYPNCRHSFQYLVEHNVHCPFCSKKGGTHNAHKHEVWKKILCIEPDIVPQEPEKTDNLETYIKSAFDFIMFNVHYSVPSFLFNLHNVQSFLECLVTLWRCFKLL